MAESVTDILSDLISINSVNPNYDGGCTESAIADYVQSFFDECGIQTSRYDVFPDRPNVIAELPGQSSGPPLVFEAHTDTAPVTGMTIPPFTAEIRDGRLYGRGACDVKGGLAAMMAALANTHAAGLTPKHPIMLAATMDEEYSYQGVLALCDRLKTAAGAVVAEPTDLHCIVASKGCLRLRFTCHGKKAHSAKPHLGVNAIQHMIDLIQLIEADTAALAETAHPLLGTATCNIGIINGGVQVNAVPETCHLEIDRRLLPAEDVDEVADGYQAMVDQLNQNDSTRRFTVEETIRDWPLETSTDSTLVRCVAKELDALDIHSTPEGVPFGSDASKLARLDIPSIILGPGSIDQAHTLDEYIDIAQLETAVTLCQNIMLNF
jgi:acetylornithine deacetylase